MMPATDADALSLLNAYGAPSLGYTWQQIGVDSATAIAYWKARLDAVGQAAAIAEMRSATAYFVASHPLSAVVATTSPASTPAAQAVPSTIFGLDSKLVIIGGLVAFFLFSGKEK